MNSKFTAAQTSAMQVADDDMQKIGLPTYTDLLEACAVVGAEHRAMHQANEPGLHAIAVAKIQAVLEPMRAQFQAKSVGMKLELRMKLRNPKAK